LGHWDFCTILLVLKRLLIGALALVVAAIALSLWRQRAPTRPSVLLISVDTLRADRLGSYGHTGAQTPVLDRLAAEGVLFSRVTTVAPLTLPAHASLMTGTFPAFHGVRDNGQFYLGDDQVTLAETLKASGYRTAGFVGAFVLDRRWGIAQGFDTYFDEFDLSRYQLAAGIDAAQRPANEVVDKAAAWIAQAVDRPFFAWVHLYDPHAPYAAPEPYASRFPRDMHGAYDAEVAFTDAQIGRLVDALGDAQSNTLVVVVGDHGESLGQHQEQQHGFFVYDSVSQVPLILVGPGVERSGRIETQISITDVMPTVLDVLRVHTPGVVQGGSHARSVARTGPETRKSLESRAVVESWYPRYHYGWSELRALREERYKFISAPRRELYDLREDPGELKNIADREPAVTEAMQRELERLTTEHMRGANRAAPQEVDADVEERLRALGYVGGSVSPRNLEDRPRGDPKDKIGLYNLLKLAGSDSVAGRIDDAIAKVQRVLSEDREVIEAHIILGNLHTKAGRHGAAITAYQQALALDDRNENAAFALALAYKSSGDPEAAEAGFARVLQMNPRTTKAHWQLAEIWMTRGDFARAEHTLATALTMEVDRPAFLMRLGESQIQLGKHREAEQHLKEALRLKPDLPMANYDLGVLHETRGDAAAAAEAYEAELRVSPGTYQAHFNLAKILSKANRVNDAVKHFRSAVDANPSFAAGYLYLAKALLDAGELRGSESAALKGLKANPEADVKPLGHYVLADVYTRMGRERDAARHVALGRRFERGGT
jgi:arylsulfatase A-like enzyme/tetratricopeptide (TPR) repeat protein